MSNETTLIFQHSRPGRSATAQAPKPVSEDQLSAIPASLRRKNKPGLPEVGELEVVRHYTNLSTKNFAIDKQFYPLGSCTMKYNPRGANRAAMLPGFLNRHPLAPASHSQGYLACMYELQNFLKEVTGMKGVSLAPMAGAQGEFAGVAMIRAYHEARGDDARTEILIPEAAHGTNPATAVMCGYKVREVPVGKDGDVDLEALKEACGPQTAGLMMTNPSTCGVFERQIEAISKAVHDAGGLLYYDGANLDPTLSHMLAFVYQFMNFCFNVTLRWKPPLTRCPLGTDHVAHSRICGEPATQWRLVRSPYQHPASHPPWQVCGHRSSCLPCEAQWQQLSNAQDEVTTSPHHPFIGDDHAHEHDTVHEEH